MAKIPTVTLSNGNEMPVLGFGVFQMSNEEAEQSVVTALETGYRSIDTAASYGNEEAVGRGIKKSGVPRDEIFVTSKLWIADASYERAKKAYQTSLDKLGLDYLDLYLMHHSEMSSERGKHSSNCMKPAKLKLLVFPTSVAAS